MAYYKAVQLDDKAMRWTAKAAGTISGGNLVMFQGTASAIGSDTSGYTWSDIVVLAASGAAATAHETVMGVALHNADSGAQVTFASQGLFALPTGSNGVSGGQPVVFVGYEDCVEKIPGGSLAQTAYPIGRAFTGATAEGAFVIVRLDV